MVRITELPDRLKILALSRVYCAVGTILQIGTIALVVISAADGNYAWGIDYVLIPPHDAPVGAGAYLLMALAVLLYNALLGWNFMWVTLDRTAQRASFLRRCLGVPLRFEVPLSSITNVFFEHVYKREFITFQFRENSNLRLPESPYVFSSEGLKRDAQRIRDWLGIRPPE